MGTVLCIILQIYKVVSEIGENETGEATPASTPATPNKTAFVQICGQKVQVKAALEVSAW